MKLKTILIATSALAVVACGDDGNTNNDIADAAPASPDADTSPPAMPALGVQIDRVGRPAIATALMETFNGDDAAKGAAKDGYNAEDDLSAWAGFTPNFMGSMAILDALDGTCGNQFGADLADDRYAFMAGVFADDQLYVNSESGDCTQYLGVELDAVLGTTNGCGGRTLTYDVIETSYSALAAGVLTGVDDTIAADADCVQSNSSFPFVCAPQ